MMAKKGILGIFKGKEEDQELEQAEARIEELEDELRQKSEREAREKTKAELRAKREREVEAAKAKRKAEKAKLEAEKEVKKHVVESGDTLTAIALKYYGNAGQFMKIYEANKDVIGDNPDRILVGMELVIPEL
jgi:nucleoid-associated protein YgaU